MSNILSSNSEDRSEETTRDIIKMDKRWINWLESRKSGDSNCKTIRYEGKKCLKRVVNFTSDIRTACQNERGECKTEIDFLSSVCCKKCLNHSRVEYSRFRPHIHTRYHFYNKGYKNRLSFGLNWDSSLNLCKSYQREDIVNEPTTIFYKIFKSHFISGTQMFNKFTPKILKTFISAIFYLILVLIILFGVDNLNQLGAYAAPLNQDINGRSLITTSKEQTLQTPDYQSYEVVNDLNNIFKREAVSSQDKRKHWKQRGTKMKQEIEEEQINKNCLEYDLTSRAHLSDLVFEGIVRSRSPEDLYGRYDVTFQIKEILKQPNIKNHKPLSPERQIRLHFSVKKYKKKCIKTNEGTKLCHRVERRNKIVGKNDNCPLFNLDSKTELVRANIRTGQKYIVMAKFIGPMNYTAMGEPVRNSKRNNRSVQSSLCSGCVKPPQVKGLKSVDKTTAEELRLTCRVYGSPVPQISWFKDGNRIIPSTYTSVTYFRRKSTIFIKSITLKDVGWYECRAKNIYNLTSSMSAYVNVTEKVSTVVTSPWPLQETKCEVDAFCLNGGQCMFFSSIGEHSCSCADGYKGQRCEKKDVSVKGNTAYFCGFNVGYSAYYC